MESKTRYTDEQKAILESRSQPVSVAVSAGAGCGKTFILTQRYLQFLHPRQDKSDPLSRIVAITFTEKAGREMRHRVRSACQEMLLRCNDADMTHWLGIVRGLDTARISTIHSYCATLLRTYAVEAGLDPGFGMLDPSFGDLFTQKAVRESLCRQLAEGDADAVNLVTRYDFERSLTILRELQRTIGMFDSEGFENHSPESLSELWRKYWEDECHQAIARELWESAAVRQVVELLEHNEPSHPTMQARRATLLEIFQREPMLESPVLEEIDALARVEKGGGAKAWINAETYEVIKETLKSLRDAVGRVQKKLANADGDNTAAVALALSVHRVASRVSKEFTATKLAESQLDFDDLLGRTRDLLRHHESVRQRAAAGIDLLMVDEFQDTDPVQSEIVRLLCGDELTTGKLFLVGDAKQSIYRFRGADPRVFATMQGILPKSGCLPLTTNFRSQPAILRFVNELFAREIENYEPLVPGISEQRSPEPAVEFLFARAGEKLSAEETRRNEARWIAGRIDELLHDPTPRVIDSESGELRRVLPGDIAILFRTLSNVALYEQALVDRGLEYFLAGGRAFFAQQETFDITHLCRWLEDPSDEMSLVGILRSPMFGLNDDTLMLLKRGRGESLSAGLFSPPRLPEIQGESVRRAGRILRELREKKDVLPLAELLSLAVSRTGYDASLLCEHLGPRKLANLRKLIGLARTFDASGPYTLSEFAARLSDAVREEADQELAVTHPEVSNVLRLMTIHQSKGLEFPVVIVADMNWSRPGGGTKAVYHSKLGPLFAMPDDGDEKPPHLGMAIHKIEEEQASQLEQIRLLYVALTRARDHLILSAGLPPDGKVRSSWMKLLARRFSLTEGRPVVDPYFASAAGEAKPPGDVSWVLAHHNEPSPPSADGKKRGEHLTLTRFREHVAESTPAQLPSLMRPVLPDRKRRREFTVTALCAVDADDREWSYATSESMGDAQPSSPIAGMSDYAKTVGTVAHNVLEHIDFSNPESQNETKLAELVERALLSLRGGVDREVASRVLRVVRSLMDSPLTAELAGAKRLHREIEFRLRWDRPAIDPPAEIIGTIDCLFQDSTDRWHLVDYKFVADANRSESDLVRRYELQLATYSFAVERLFGVRPASLRLARLGTELQVYEVAMSSESLDRAADRIDRTVSHLRSDDVNLADSVEWATDGD